MKIREDAAPRPAQDSDAATEWQTPPSLPLYFAAFVISICGLYAVNLELDDQSFSLMTEALVLLGFFVSYISRKFNVSSRAVEIPAVILCTMLALVVVVSNEIPSFLAPAGASGDRGKALALLLTWLVVLRSFTLVSDGHLLFCCVPTIAMMGLIATSNNQPELLTAFIVFLCAAAFMMVHENYLRTRPAELAHSAKSASALLFGSQLQMTAFCALGAALVANVIATPLQSLGLYVVPVGIYPPNTANKSSSSITPTNFSESREIRVGTGPVKLSNQIVLHVKSDVSAYWRGASFDEYTGHGWKDTIGSPVALSPEAPRRDANALLGDAQPPFGSNQYRIPMNELNAVGPRRHRVTQTIHLEPGATFREIYAASEPRLVRIGGQISADKTGSIHITDMFQASTYEVESEIPADDAEVLKRSSQDYPAVIKQYYLQLPDNPEAMNHIRDAALTATRGARTEYDRVVALMQLVDQNCKYNLDAAAVPEDKDVVESFLFETHEGYCDSFAAALAILCRSVGIPARVASGFLPGELESGTQLYAVRERDKHQWTEVYFPNAGWIKFDATGEAEDITASDTQNNAAQRQSFWSALFKRGWLPPLALFAFIVMVGYVLKVEVLDRARRPRTTVGLIDLPAANLAIVTAYEAACGALAKRGLGRTAASTPAEYMAAMQKPLAVLPDALAALDQLTPLFIRYRYSRESASAQDVEQAQSALRRLQTALKDSGRRSLALAPAAGGA